jgi:hypothetical protein
VKDTVFSLIQEGFTIEEIIKFIAKSKGIPVWLAEQRVREFLAKEKPSFSYKLFEKKEEEEKAYFLRLAKERPIEELAEIFAEMAVMLERALVLNSFYLYKLKEKEGRRDEKEVRKGG